jgi:hypothetical protein
MALVRNSNSISHSSFGLKVPKYLEATPGPLDYNVPRCKPDAKTDPSFTMRCKIVDFHHEDSNPGPDKYYPILPASEKVPSLKGMHKDTKVSKTPGPAVF